MICEGLENTRTHQDIRKYELPSTHTHTRAHTALQPYIKVCNKPFLNN